MRATVALPNLATRELTVVTGGYVSVPEIHAVTSKDSKRSIVDGHRNDIALVLPATGWTWQIAGAPVLIAKVSNAA